MGMVPSKRRLDGYALVYDAPGPGIQWSAKSAFSWAQGAVKLTWCHNYMQPNDVIGFCKLEQRSDGIFCYAYLKDAAWFNALASDPAIGFSVLVGHQVYGAGAYIKSGQIEEVSLTGCPASFWYRMRPGQRPAEFTSAVCIPASRQKCCVETGGPRRW
jgi:hypothetical protein